MIIEKKYHFYSAHRNKEAGEKCGRLHGHTYEIVCHFKFETLENGVTMLFSEIDKIVEPLVKQYDHYLLLYERDPLCGYLDFAQEPYIDLPFETSAENLAIWIFNLIKNRLPIYKIELSETKTSKVVYEDKN
jgi:6-pyruvoyltetrahydropterin/6-carboxytetrahydropterin synthase